MRSFGAAISGDLRFFWTNAVITSLADSLTSLALMLLMLNTTGSLTLMAMVSIMTALPNVVIGLFSSVLVDRWEPVRIVQFSQLARAGIVCCFVLVDVFDAIWLVFIIAFAQSVVGTFDDPSRMKISRALTDVETRLSVTSFTQSGRTIASVCGTTLGGMIVASTGDKFSPVFLVSSALYAFSG